MENYKEYKPHHLKRIVWFFINHTIFRLLCFGAARPLSSCVLRAFGAKVGKRSFVYGTADIYAPWNLVVEDHSCIAPHVNVYCKDKVIIRSHSIVSQGSYLCTATHDYTDKDHSLVTRPIVIGNDVWVAADAFIGPGVTIGDGAIVGARSCVFKDVEPWSVIGGNPSRFIKKRIMK